MRIKEARQERGQKAWFRIVACKACGAEWTSDPALQAACSECQARPGERCIWRGRHGYTYHISRDVQAMRQGYLTACDALTWDGRHSRDEILVCDQPPLPSPAPMPAHVAAAATSPQLVQPALL